MFQPRFTALLVGFVLLPMVVPPVVSAITLYFLLTSLSGVSSLFGYDTWLGVAMAHSVMTVPFATVLILVALSQVDRRIDLAARGLGASTWQRATGRSSSPTSSSASSPQRCCPSSCPGRRSA